ncbi:hypothetical protein BT69DRAFT_1302060 [Atractiella rhizophila]|nr:hypothetical protein BT69DRAFT_1302060 [Atractiella rhizophila]
MKTTLISAIALLATLSSASSLRSAEKQRSAKRAIASGTVGCLQAVFEDGTTKWIKDEENNFPALEGSEKDASGVFLQVKPTAQGGNINSVTVEVTSSLSKGLFLTFSGDYDGVYADTYETKWSFDAESGHLSAGSSFAFYGCETATTEIVHWFKEWEIMVSLPPEIISDFLDELVQLQRSQLMEQRVTQSTTK